MSGVSIVGPPRPLITLMGSTANKIFYGDSGGAVQEIAFGSVGQHLVSTGPTTPPTWQTLPAVPTLVGATLTTNGVAGLVPQPAAGQQLLFLRGDGAWASPPVAGEVNDGQNINLTGEGLYAGKVGISLQFYGVAAASNKLTVALDAGNGVVTVDVNESNLTAFTGATGSVNGTKGVVPMPTAGQQLRFLRGDGVWALSGAGTAFTGATSITNGTIGAVPMPTAGQQAMFLRGDGIWAAGSSGSVTSITLNMPGQFVVAPTNTITTFGTFGVTWAVQTANFIFAGPTTGVAAAPTFRSLVAGDIPGLSGSQITSGVIAIARGGLGVDTTATTVNALMKRDPSSAAFIDSELRVFRSTGSNTGKLIFDIAALTADRTITFPNTSGTLVTLNSTNGLTIGASPYQLILGSYAPFNTGGSPLYYTIYRSSTSGQQGRATIRMWGVTSGGFTVGWSGTLIVYLTAGACRAVWAPDNPQDGVPPVNIRAYDNTPVGNFEVAVESLPFGGTIACSIEGNANAVVPFSTSGVAWPSGTMIFTSASTPAAYSYNYEDLIPSVIDNRYWTRSLPWNVTAVVRIIPINGDNYVTTAATEELIVDPAGTIAAMTINLPASAANGRTITLVGGEGTVTALTLVAGTGSIATGHAITTLVPGQRVTYRYFTSTSKWYAVA